MAPKSLPQLRMTEGIVQDQLYPFERLNLYGSKGVFSLPQLASSIMQQLDPIEWSKFIDKYDFINISSLDYIIYSKLDLIIEY